MRPAQLTPENRIRSVDQKPHRLASMRPAQLTPENAPDQSGAEAAPRRFNEAGAINAGKRESIADPETLKSMLQ